MRVELLGGMGQAIPVCLGVRGALGVFLFAAMRRRRRRLVQIDRQTMTCFPQVAEWTR
jgi:hypothetical protein